MSEELLGSIPMCGTWLWRWNNTSNLALQKKWSGPFFGPSWELDYGYHSTIHAGPSSKYFIGINTNLCCESFVMKKMHAPTECSIQHAQQLSLCFCRGASVVVWLWYDSNGIMTMIKLTFCASLFIKLSKQKFDLIVRTRLFKILY